MKRPLAMGALVLGCASVPASEGHVELFLWTDAPVPASVGEVAMFDTVRFEIHRDEEAEPCADCIREFSVSRSMLERGASWTVVSGHRLVVHACLFRAEWGCAPATSIEAWVRVPPPPSAGRLAMSVPVMLAALGTPNGSRLSPIDGWPGASPRYVPWNESESIGCENSTHPSEASVGGGTFWMGNPLANSADDAPPRFVWLDPFFLDEHEVTVADYRAVFGNNPVGVERWSGRYGGGDLHDYCTFTSEPGPHEELPINCVTWNASRAYCTRIGKDLPTEAQFEYAASRGRGDLFVWGNDWPTCGDAVWARQNAEHARLFGVAADACAKTHPPMPASTQRADVGRDRFGSRVIDLAGNVAEWVQDGFQRGSASCWSFGGIYHNPRCLEPEESPLGGPLRSVRGGAWFHGAIELAASRRKALIATELRGEVGFRCARSK